MVLVFLGGGDALEIVRVGLQQEHQIQRIGRQQHERGSEVDELLVTQRLWGEKNRLNALGTPRLTAEISIIELYSRAAPALYSWV